MKLYLLLLLCQVPIFEVTAKASKPSVLAEVEPSLNSRDVLIQHLLNDGIHKGRHTEVELKAMSTSALESLHNFEHNEYAGTPGSTKWHIRSKQQALVKRRKGLFFEW